MKHLKFYPGQEVYRITYSYKHPTGTVCGECGKPKDGFCEYKNYSLVKSAIITCVSGNSEDGYRYHFYNDMDDYDMETNIFSTKAAALKAIDRLNLEEIKKFNQRNAKKNK